MKIILLVCSVFTLSFVVCSKIPSYINICYRNDPAVSKCIGDAIYHLLPYLKAGLPEFDIPSVEPLVLGKVKLNTGTEAARVYANLSDIKVWNASTTILQDLTADVTRNIYRCKAIIPRLRLEGNYEIDTKILFLRIKGNGPFHVNVTNYYFDCTLKGNPNKHGGVEHLVFEKMKCDISFEKASIRLERLFEQNAVLAKATNDVINDNLLVFFDAMKANLVEAITTTFTNIANKITYKFDYNEIFPYRKRGV